MEIELEETCDLGAYFSDNPYIVVSDITVNGEAVNEDHVITLVSGQKYVVQYYFTEDYGE